MYAKECRWFAAPHNLFPSCLPSVHVAPRKVYLPARHPQELHLQEKSISAVRLGMSLLKQGERRMGFGARGEQPPCNSTVFVLISVGAFPVNVLRVRGGRLGCPAPEALMLPGTPLLKRPWAPFTHIPYSHRTDRTVCVGKDVWDLWARRKHNLFCFLLQQ